MQKITSIDQMGRSITLDDVPKRIISLVPSQTELLFHLGLAARIVGITKFCVHPAEECEKASKIGGTKKLNIGKIRDLQPDLIIGNKEENQKEQIEELQKHFPVWMSDIFDLEDALQMMRAIGELTGKTSESIRLSDEISNQFKTLRNEVKRLDKPSPKILYFIWRKPWMCAGKNTFVDVMISEMGGQNVQLQSRYPEISVDEIKSLQPDYIFLSSEPYPFKGKHKTELAELCPVSKILLVDGEMFSWYGSRLLQTPKYLAELMGKIDT